MRATDAVVIHLTQTAATAVDAVISTEGLGD